MATASLHTNGNILTNSRWPPKSHIEKVMVVRRTVIVFSIKLTPSGGVKTDPINNRMVHLTERLDVVLVEAAFDIFHHKTRFTDLRVAHHPNFDDNA